VPDLIDIIRYVVLLEGGVVLGLSLFAFRLYRYARRLALHQGSPAGAGPYHVAFIAAGHCLLVAALMLFIAAHLGESPVASGVALTLCAGGFTLSLIGLYSVLQYENSQIRRYLKPHK
jgi:ABC-type uncharacterized transport system permease subunit